MLLRRRWPMRRSPHPYIPNSAEATRRVLLQELGIEDVEDLYVDIPQEVRLKRRLNLPERTPEIQVKRRIVKMLSENVSCDEMPTFLGGGCWPHYVPAAVKYVVQRTEFLTPYTPYQPEISQGVLQALFEYQSMICELTGMEVANSSMYDWSTSAGEAARMAVRCTKRSEVLVPETMSPQRYEVMKTYTEPSGISLKKVGYDPVTGQLDIDDLESKLTSETAAVYIENPSYLGFIETQVDEISQLTHSKGALLIVGVDPTSLGVLKPPGDYGADIVVGEGQPLGNPMNFGGPLLGIFACRGERNLIRQMPGRIIGMTKTQKGDRRAFCMALQTREQHIRRERATSNICTNNALCAVAAAVYLALLGPKGLEDLGKTILERSHYAMRLLSKIDGIKSPLFKSPHFKEFTVNLELSNIGIVELHRRLLKRGIQGGKTLTDEFPALGETALYCVTEMHEKKDIELLANTIKRILEEE